MKTKHSKAERKHMLLTPVPKEMWAGPAAARLRDLPESERAPFNEWLRGSAAPCLTGVASHEQDAFYIHDYLSWKSKSDRSDVFARIRALHSRLSLAKAETAKDLIDAGKHRLPDFK